MNSLSKSVPPSPAVCKGWLPKESPVSSSLSLFSSSNFLGDMVHIMDWGNNVDDGHLYGLWYSITREGCNIWISICQRSVIFERLKRQKKYQTSKVSLSRFDFSLPPKNLRSIFPVCHNLGCKLWWGEKTFSDLVFFCSPVLPVGFRF